MPDHDEDVRLVMEAMQEWDEVLGQYLTDGVGEFALVHILARYDALAAEHGAWKQVAEDFRIIERGAARTPYMVLTTTNRKALAAHDHTERLMKGDVR